MCKRVFITDDADILPRYLRFVRGLVDSADLPLNVSREMIQESPLLAAIRKGVTGRVLGELEQARGEGARRLREDLGHFRRRCSRRAFTRILSVATRLLGLTRFKTTASADEWRSLKDYVGALKDNQTAIYYLAGDDIERLKPRRISKVSAPAASRYCCCPIRSTVSG